MLTTVRTKVIGLAVGTLLVTAVVYVLLNSLIFSRSYTQVLESESRFVAQLLELQLQELFDYGLTIDTIDGFEDQTRRVIAEYADVAYAYVVDDGGETRFLSQRSPITTELAVTNAELAALKQIDTTVRLLDGIEYLDTALPVIQDAAIVGYVRVGIPLQRSRTVTFQLLRRLSLAAVLLLLAATLLLLWLSSRWIARPLGRLVAFVNQVRSDHDLSRRLEFTGHDEIGQLGNAFNELLADLEGTRRALDAYTARLELLVAERTAGLEQSNRLLHADILQREAVEARLRKHQQIIDSAHEGMAISGVDGTLLYANAAMAGLCGYGHATALVGLPWSSFYPEADQGELAQAIRRSLASSGRWSGELTGRRLDGQQLPLDVSVTVTEDGDWGWVVRDISERKQTQAALLQSQKLESVGRLAGGVAHDFNNLLTGILGQTALARYKLPAESPALRHLDKAELSIERASDLTRQLLAYAGKGQFQIVTMDLNQVVQELRSLAEIALPKTTRLDITLAKEPLLVVGDVSQIHQAIMNLVINAGEAQRTDTDSVTLATRRGSVDNHDPVVGLVGNGTLAPGAYAVLSVRDTGHGMDHETLLKAFDPFFTTKGVGRGLGLAAALGIVQAQGGGIQIESRSDQGTEVCIWLPLVVDPAANPQGTVKSAAATLPKSDEGLILLVDDEEVVRTAISDILQAAGYETVVAVDGVDGMARFEQQRDEIRLVLLDVVMPGLSGNELYRRIRRTDPLVPVILSSGYSADHITADVVGDPNATFLKKPYSVKQLVEMLDNMLGNGKGR